MPLYNPAKDLEDYLKAKNQPFDFAYRKQEYEDKGLMGKLGEFRGSEQQNRATLNLLKAEDTLAEARKKVTGIQSVVTQGIKLKEAGIPITKETQFAPTEEFKGAFPDLAETKKGALRYNEKTGVAEMFTPEGWTRVTPKVAESQAGGGIAKQIIDSSESNVPVSPQSLTLSDADIGNIITDIGKGEISSPEIVLAKQEAEGLEEADKIKLSSDLSKIQQNMAKVGMTFSSIRSSAEEGAAAESLARQSGISIKLAEAIVKSARQEQERRLDVIKFQQTAQRTALSSMGYTVDPISGGITKTLERERFEEPKGIKFISNQGSLYSYDPDSSEMKMIIQAEPKERNLNIRYFTDDEGMVTKVVTDPLTGEELGREEIGDLGRKSSSLLSPEQRAAWDEFVGTEEQSNEDAGWWGAVTDFLGGILK